MEMNKKSKWNVRHTRYSSINEYIDVEKNKRKMSKMTSSFPDYRAISPP